MDSITHVVLGAAIGDVVLGKKLGNRAMIWGSIGGSLPDFDVLSNFFLDPLNAMTFHRGPMHSLLFVFIMPFILGPLIKRLYDGTWFKKTGWKITGYSTGILLYSLSSVILCLICSLLFKGIPWLLIGILSIVGIYFFLIRYHQIFKQEREVTNVSVKEWTLLFLWTVPVHTFLDSLTTYGTVLFWPFSDMRIAISSISIADPLYTIPFAVFVLLAAIEQRNYGRRKLYNWIGIGISTSYLILTGINKKHINELFEESLKSKQINYSEYMTVPTILNNVLWYGIAKQDSGYTYGYYSMFDKEDSFADLKFIPGNHQSLVPYRDQNAVQLLTWFSSGYYSIIPVDEKTFQYNDLRFGSMSGKMNNKEDYIFKFNLVDSNEILTMVKQQDRPENKPEDIKWFKNRIIGISK
jgi:inner membrane protein